MTSQRTVNSPLGKQQLMNAKQPLSAGLTRTGRPFASKRPGRRSPGERLFVTGSFLSHEPNHEISKIHFLKFDQYPVAFMNCHLFLDWIKSFRKMTVLKTVIR